MCQVQSTILFKQEYVYVIHVHAYVHVASHIKRYSSDNVHEFDSFTQLIHVYLYDEYCSAFTNCIKMIVFMSVKQTTNNYVTFYV